MDAFFDTEMDQFRDSQAKTSSSASSDKTADFDNITQPPNEDAYTDKQGFPFLYSEAMDMYMRRKECIQTEEINGGKETFVWVPDNIQCYVDLLFHLKQHHVDKKLFDLFV